MDEELTYQKFIKELDNFLIEKKRDWNSSSLRNNKYYFQTLLIPFLNNRPLNRSVLIDFFNHLKDQKKTEATRRQAEISILQFVIWLFDNDIILKNWAKTIKRTKVHRVHRILPSLDEVQLLIRKVCEPKKTDNILSRFSKNEHMFCLLSMATWGGTRNCETRSIKLNEVSISERQVLISKGKNGARTISIPEIPWLIEELDRRVKGRTPEELRCIADRKHYKRDNSDMLFVVNAGRLEAIMREVGKLFGHEMEVHDLRRICLRDLKKNGEQTDNIQNVAGHKAISTTQIYLEYDTNGQRKSLNTYSSEARKYRTPETKAQEAMRLLSGLGILEESSFDGKSSTFKVNWT